MVYADLIAIFKERIDSDRIPILYRVIPSRDVCPGEWDEQFSFWCNILQDWISQSEICFFSYKEVLESLVIEDTLPPLSYVMAHFIEIGLIKQFSVMEPKRSLTNFIKKFIFDKISRGNQAELSESSEFTVEVNMSGLIEEMRSRVLISCSSQADLLVTDAKLKEMAKSCPLPPVLSILAKRGYAIRISDLGVAFKDPKYPQMAAEPSLRILQCKVLIDELARITKEQRSENEAEVIQMVSRLESTISLIQIAEPKEGVSEAIADAQVLVAKIKCSRDQHNVQLRWQEKKEAIHVGMPSTTLIGEM